MYIQNIIVGSPHYEMVYSMRVERLWLEAQCTGGKDHQ